jgi:hypothetical protein
MNTIKGMDLYDARCILDMPDCLTGEDREGSSDSQECGEHMTTYYTIQKQIGSMVTSLLGAERGSIARKLKPDKPRVKRVDHCPFDLGESTSQRVVIMCQCLYERDESGWFENFRDKMLPVSPRTARSQPLPMSMQKISEYGSMT